MHACTIIIHIRCSGFGVTAEWLFKGGGGVEAITVYYYYYCCSDLEIRVSCRVGYDLTGAVLGSTVWNALFAEFFFSFFMRARTRVTYTSSLDSNVYAIKASVGVQPFESAAFVRSRIHHSANDPYNTSLVVAQLFLS